MATVTRMPQQRQGWSQPCSCGCHHPPGTPCPPPECRPCPDPSWMLWGQQLLAWNQQIQQLKQLVKEIVQEIGGPVQTGPIQGVTDGSDVQPGQVGEFLNYSFPNQPFTAPAEGQQTILLSAGVLPPGDWDLHAYCLPDTSLDGFNFQLVPVPEGFSSWMGATVGATPTQASPEGWTSAVCLRTRALISVPTLMPFQMIFYNYTNSDVSGTFEFYVNARRMR